MFKIRKAVFSDIEEIIGIYIEQFPKNRSAVLGRRFLREFFLWFIRDSRAISFTAVKDNRIAGFVVGSSRGYGGELFRLSWPVILRECLLRPYLLLKPGLYRHWRVYLRPFFSAKSAKAGVSGEKVTLASIAVGQAYKKQGIASVLIEAFEKEAAGRGFRLLSLSVEPENYPANKFYQKHGWQKHSADTESVCYTKQLNAG